MSRQRRMPRELYTNLRLKPHGGILSCFETGDIQKAHTYLQDQSAWGYHGDALVYLLDFCKNADDYNIMISLIKIYFDHYSKRYVITMLKDAEIYIDYNYDFIAYLCDFGYRHVFGKAFFIKQSKKPYLKAFAKNNSRSIRYAISKGYRIYLAKYNDESMIPTDCTFAIRKLCIE